MKNQTITLGDFELTAISDGTYVADGGAFFGIIPKSHVADAKSRRTSSTASRVSCNSVLVRTGKQTMLIETGIGNKLEERDKRFLIPRKSCMDNLRGSRLSSRKKSMLSSILICILTIAAGIPFTKMARRWPLFPMPDILRPGASGNMAKLQTERDRISYLSHNYDPLIRSGQMTAH